MRAGLTTLVSYTPGGASPRVLGQRGHLLPPTYSWTDPGGCDTLTAVFSRPPRKRVDALDNGRLLRAHRGGSIVWEGILDEPAPGPEGWQIAAHGAGSWGNDYRAIWSPPWDTSIPDDVVNAAIARGLRWVNPGIGAPAGLWMGQAFDSATQSVTDVLNLGCTKGGLTWLVRTVPGGNILNLVPLPTVPNRLLTTADPAPRSIAAGPTTLYIRYQATWDDPDNQVEATYATTSVTNSLLEASTGRREETVDISSAGVQTAGQAQAVGNQIMKRFTRVAFTEPFTIRPGQLQNMGGQPVDPGAFYQDGQYGMVIRLLLADYAPGSDSPFGPPEFRVGAYEWNDADVIGTATPAESLLHDFGSLMSMIAETLPERTQPTSTKKAGK